MYVFSTMLGHTTLICTVSGIPIHCMLMMCAPLHFNACPQHSSEEVIRWEESKKWQKKLTTLRAKLMEKSREVDEVHKQSKSLKDIIER